ncbi:hypothetical protein [Streptomyces sp. NPDC101393]|uniref:DUF7544 domain-containing protein n=1 Tax=Streptomyces sp. NPDC101393 TaxID=3366141 RepID=UPI0037F287F9
MNNSPGWASPGSAPSDEPDRGTQEPPAPRPAPEDGPASAEQPSPPNWSKEQPPAGQWSAPAGIPGQSGPGGRRGPGSDRARAGSGPGQGGWGSPPGPGNQAPWGGGWSPTPPAAKPGVIPLRPLGVGEILDGAVSTMRAHWRTVLGISLIVAVVSQAAITVVTGLWFQGSDRAPSLEANPGPALVEFMRDIGNSLLGSAITSLIGLLATLVATGLLTMIVSRAVLGRSVTTADAWRDARGQLPRLLGLLVLLPLLITAVIAVCLAPGILASVLGTLDLGLILSLFGGLAAIVLSIWLMVRFSLSSPALMLEKQGVIASMRRSAKLVRGSWWRVLGVQLLAYLLIAIVEFIVQIPATIIAFLIGGENIMDWANGTDGSTGWTFLTVLGIGAVISSTLTIPVSAGVTALLYMDQRIRREALDLELARAAGLPGYGPQAPTAPASPVPTPEDGPQPPSLDKPTTVPPAANAPATGDPGAAGSAADRPESATGQSAGKDTAGTEDSGSDTTGPATSGTTPPPVDAADPTSTAPDSPDAPADGPERRPGDSAPGS